MFEAIIHQKVPGKEALPEIGIYGVKEDQPVEMSASFWGTDIYVGSSTVRMGYNITGKAKVLNKFALVDLQLSLLRLAGRGTLPEIDLGFLLITGRGIEGQKGPMLDIEVSLSRVNVGVSGEIILNPQGIMRLFPGANIKEIEECYNEIFQARTKEDISLDAKGINFSFETNLFGLYDVSLQGRTITEGDKDITLTGKMEQQFLDTIKNGLEKNIMILHDAINKDIQDKQKQVNNIDTLIAQKNKQIQDNTNKIKKITEELTAAEVQANKKQEEILAKLNINPAIAKAIKSGLRNTSDIQNQIRGDLDNKLEKAQQEVDKILDQIHTWENRQAECAAAPANRLDLKAEWVALGGLIAGAWATHAIAYGILEEIQKINAGLPTVTEIDAAVKTATLIPASVPKYAARESLELKNSSLKTEIVILQKTKEAATFALKGSKDINDFAGETLQNIAKVLSPLTKATDDATTLINIREVSFSTGLRELLIDKKLPQVTVKLSLLNKEIPDFSMQCDLKKPHEFIMNMANYIVKAIQALTAKQRL
jgi:F0F1-type ATP synthase membrane subunit b/b'